MPEFENTPNHNGREEPIVQLGKSRVKPKQASDKKNQNKITVSVKPSKETLESISQPIENSFVPGVLGEKAKETKVKLSFSNRAKNDTGNSQIHTRWHAKSSDQGRANPPRFSVGEINLEEDSVIPKDDFKEPSKKPNFTEADGNTLDEKSGDSIRQREMSSKSSNRGRGRRDSNNDLRRQERFSSRASEKQELPNTRSREDRIERKTSRNQDIESHRRRPSQNRTDNQVDRKASDYKRRQDGKKSSNTSVVPKSFFAKIKYFFQVLLGISEPPKVKRRPRGREDKTVKSLDSRSRRAPNRRSSGNSESNGNRRRVVKRKDSAQSSSADSSSRGRNRNYNRRRGNISSSPRNSSPSES